MQVHAIMALKKTRIPTITAISNKNTKIYQKNMMFILIIPNTIKKHNLFNKNKKRKKFPKKN
jgi:hypothetical protein